MHTQILEARDVHTYLGLNYVFYPSYSFWIGVFRPPQPILTIVQTLQVCLRKRSNSAVCLHELANKVCVTCTWFLTMKLHKHVQYTSKQLQLKLEPQISRQRVLQGPIHPHIIRGIVQTPKDCQPPKVHTTMSPKHPMFSRTLGVHLQHMCGEALPCFEPHPCITIGVAAHHPTDALEPGPPLAITTPVLLVIPISDNVAVCITGVQHGGPWHNVPSKEGIVDQCITHILVPVMPVIQSLTGPVCDECMVCIGLTYGKQCRKQPVVHILGLPHVNEVPWTKSNLVAIVYSRTELPVDRMHHGLLKGVLFLHNHPILEMCMMPHCNWTRQ